MPTALEAQFWNHVELEQFSEVARLLGEHPNVDFINSQDPDGYSLPIYLLLFTVSLRAQKPRELIQQVLLDSRIDWSFAARTGKKTAAHAVLDVAKGDGDFSLIIALKDIPEFILNNNGAFTYDVALKYVRLGEKVLGNCISVQSPKEEINKSKATLERYRNMADLVRDITLLHAIATDKDDLFELVMNADGKEPEKLGAFARNSEICDLLDEKNPNPKIKAWRLKQWDKGAAQREANQASLIENLARLSFFQTKIQTIKDEAAAKESQILDQAAKQRLGRIETAIKAK